MITNGINLNRTDLDLSSVSPGSNASNANNLEDDKFPTDIVELSTPAIETAGGPYVKTGRPGVYIDAGHEFVRINDALTRQDKELVVAAVGGLDLKSASGTHQINQLAMQIAMDRAIGNLTGPVTASYLQNILDAQQRDLALNREQADALSRAGDTLTADAIKSQGPGIPFDVLEKALAFLALRDGNNRQPSE